MCTRSHAASIAESQGPHLACVWGGKVAAIPEHDHPSSLATLLVSGCAHRDSRSCACWS